MIKLDLTNVDQVAMPDTVEGLLKVNKTLIHRFSYFLAPLYKYLDHKQGLPSSKTLPFPGSKLFIADDLLTFVEVSALYNVKYKLKCMTIK